MFQVKCSTSILSYLGLLKLSSSGTISDQIIIIIRLAKCGNLAHMLDRPRSCHVSLTGEPFHHKNKSLTPI